MTILILDNYDSFTYNLAQLVSSFGCKVIVELNDKITSADIEKNSPDKIIISPGPGRPENSKISISAIKNFGQRVPILGVCLGHQAIAICFGGKVVTADRLMHGKTSKITHNNTSVFKNLPQNFDAMRYHSLIVDRETLPSELLITAESDDRVIMGIEHKQFPITGIQFHPESILTPEGKKIIKNWLDA
ncbi:MAG TPA: aminodeoxychorismate/anthranilate synthase component II [Ignavibacteriaceae bacterium]|nr:aminodeoxychorismate/anthranilate synthase component II [Ignavibacteriaceae bacterium]